MTKHAAQPIRRRILLLDKRFQLRFMVYVTSWILVLSLIFPAIIFNIFEWLMRFASQHLTIPQMQALSSVESELLFNLGLLEAAFMALVLLISFFLSHRIAGPIYKIRKFLQDARDGRLPSGLQFRKKDHFQELATDFNEMVRGVRNRNGEVIDIIASSIVRVEGAVQQASGGAKQDLQTALDQLRQARDKLSG